MRRNSLGATGIDVSELAFGSARLGGTFNRLERTETIRLLRQAVDGGINLFDTSNIYGNGDSESLIGEALNTVRHDVILCTKVGYELPSQRHWAIQAKRALRPIVRKLKVSRKAIPQAVRGTVSHNFEPEAMESSVYASLKRLQTNYLDILLLHSPTPDDMRESGAFETLRTLVKRGDVRWVGVSFESCDDIPFAPRMDVAQLPLNAMTTDSQWALARRLADQGVGIMGRQCLAAGILTKPPSDLLDDRDFASASAIQAQAQACGVSMARCAYKASIREPAVVATSIIGFSRDQQIEEALSWLD